ncbi:MAG: hypothetical protein EA343_10800 [Nodularia sp. (in: Bacteria)]|nr:MAG: hypothetical protein EA343_10800 [Nodularia sp. (in: cyanobacteria)]
MFWDSVEELRNAMNVDMGETLRIDTASIFPAIIPSYSRMYLLYLDKQIEIISIQANILNS